jgi:hypothetical protein
MMPYGYGAYGGGGMFGMPMGYGGMGGYGMPMGYGGYGGMGYGGPSMGMRPPMMAPQSYSSAGMFQQPQQQPTPSFFDQIKQYAPGQNQASAQQLATNQQAVQQAQGQMQDPMGKGIVLSEGSRPMSGNFGTTWNGQPAQNVFLQPPMAAMIYGQDPRGRPAMDSRWDVGNRRWTA